MPYKDPEKQREQSRRWKASNPEKVQEQRIKWKTKNRDKQRAAAKKWDKAHPEKKREYERKWRTTHRDQVRQWNSHRRALEQSAVVSTVDLEFVWNRSNGICYLCGKAIEPKDRNFDHVIPLSKGGEHSNDNLRPTHSFCNRSKGNKIIKWIQAKLF